MRARLGTLLLALAACAPLAHGQGYPSKPIRFIVPFPPGGGNDLLARELAQSLAEPLGQTVIVDNRPGASTIIGTELAAKAPPDGHTIFMGNNRIIGSTPEVLAKTIEADIARWGKIIKQTGLSLETPR